MSTPTQQEVFTLHEVWRKAEEHFVTVYTNQARVLGVRPGDFRYMRDRHNGTVLRAGDAFVVAGDAWRKAYNSRNQADDEIRDTATALLSRIDNLTTDEFMRGGDRAEREALRDALGIAR